MTSDQMVLSLFLVFLRDTLAAAVAHRGRGFSSQLSVHDRQSLTLISVQFVNLTHSPLASYGGAVYASVAFTIVIFGCSFV
jgi:hypothetical protein